MFYRVLAHVAFKKIQEAAYAEEIRVHLQIRPVLFPKSAGDRAYPWLTMAAWLPAAAPLLSSCLFLSGLSTCPG